MKKHILENCGLLNKYELEKVGFIYKNEGRVKFDKFRRLHFDSSGGYGFTKSRYDGDISEPECFEYGNVFGLFLPFNNLSEIEESLDWLEARGRRAYGIPRNEFSIKGSYHKVEGMILPKTNINEIVLGDVILLDNYDGGNADLKRIEYFRMCYLRIRGLIDKGDKLFKPRLVRKIIRGEIVDTKRLI